MILDLDGVWLDLGLALDWFTISDFTSRIDWSRIISKSRILHLRLIQHSDVRWCVLGVGIAIQYWSWIESKSQILHLGLIEYSNIRQCVHRVGIGVGLFQNIRFYNSD